MQPIFGFGTIIKGFEALTFRFAHEVRVKKTNTMTGAMVQPNTFNRLFLEALKNFIVGTRYKTNANL